MARASLPRPGPGKPMSEMTLVKFLPATGPARTASVRGFRSTCHNWTSECTTAPRAAWELNLARAVGSGAEPADARSDTVL